MRRVLCAAVLVSWTTVSACSAPSEMADLAGTYVLSIQTDTLRLDSLGRYARVYAQMGAPERVAVDRGPWHLCW